MHHGKIANDMMYVYVCVCDVDCMMCIACSIMRGVSFMMYDTGYMMFQNRQ